MAKNTKYEECQRPLTSLFYNVFDKKPSGANTSCSAIKNRIIPNRWPDEGLHMPIIRKFGKR